MLTSIYYIMLTFILPQHIEIYPICLCCLKTATQNDHLISDKETSHVLQIEINAIKFNWCNLTTIYATLMVCVP